MKIYKLAPLLLAVTLCSCTSMVPRKNLPYPITNDTFGDQVKTVTIPLPVIASSPNEGITYGGLVAFLLHNKKDEVSSLVVPQVNYNQYFGVTSSLYGAFYPAPDRNWNITIAQATRVNHEYRLRYADEALVTRKFEVSGTIFDFADGSSRFFGFQSRSTKENQTNYADREAGVELEGGYRFGHEDRMEVLLGERFKKVDIGRGAIDKIPFITERFPVHAVPGADGFTVHSQRVSLVYNSLDSRSLPIYGGLAKVSVDASFKALGSSADYERYQLEYRRYVPVDDARFITVFRFAANQTRGRHVPFLEQSILGGETTLRGYGQNRFIDKSFLLLNLEERIRLFRWEIFDVRADWEVAPFMDFGSVMRSLVDAKPSSFEFNPGVGLRAVVRPNIIGRIDVGVGREGPAVFVGLGYPF